MPSEQHEPEREQAREAVRLAAWKPPHVTALMACRKAGVSFPELLKWIREDDPDAFPLSVEQP